MVWLLLLLSLLVAGLAYEFVFEALDRRRFPAPGQIAAVQNTRLHIAGGPPDRTQPTVVFEAGISGTLLGWALVQPHIHGSFSYDRAGLGWSGRPQRARTVQNMTDELAGALEQLGIEPPYILVGHSFGGLLVRAFAHSYPERVGGLVLVDPVSIENWAACGNRDRHRLNVGVSLAHRGAWLARFGIVRLLLSLLVRGGHRLSALFGRRFAGKGSAALERLVGQARRLPAPEQRILRSHWSNPKSFEAMAAYLGCLPDAACAAASMQVPEELPLTVLSASTATAEELAERDRWVCESARGEHIVVAGANHWIQLEKPDAVIDAVRRMLQTRGER